MMSRLSSLEAEAGLIGAVLMESVKAQQCLGLKPEHFFDPTHAAIWRVVSELSHEGVAISVVTVAPRMQGALGDQTGEVLAGIAAGQCVPVQAPHYAKQIRALAARRQAALLFEQGIEEITNMDNEGEEVIAQAIGYLTNLSGEGARQSLSKRQVATSLVDGLSTEIPCYKTGIKGLDDVMGGGLYQGKFYGVAARKKVGKTILLGSVSHNLNMSGTKHLFIPFEMSPDEIEQRNAARACEFNSVKFLTRDDPEMGKKLAQYALSVPDNTIYEYHPGATLDDIRAMIARHVVKSGIKGVILDYWQLVGGKAPRDTEEYHLRNVAQSLAAIARREGLFILTAAQVNQDGNTRGGEGLKLACDQYFTLHREKDDHEAWMKMEESRYTVYRDVGSKNDPGLWMNKNGPHFEDNIGSMGF